MSFCSIWLDWIEIRSSKTKVTELLYSTYISHKYLLPQQTDTQIRNEFPLVGRKCDHFLYLWRPKSWVEDLILNVSSKKGLYTIFLECLCWCKSPWIWPIYEWKKSSLSISYNDAFPLKDYPSVFIFVAYCISRLPFSVIYFFPNALILKT